MHNDSPDNSDSLDRLLRQQLLNGPQSRADLMAVLGGSQPSFSRRVARLGDQLVRIGAGPSTRYALRRVLRGLPPLLPVLRVSEQGIPVLIGHLEPVYARGYVYRSEDTQQAAMYPGIPWFMEDMRLQGFLGRAFAQRGVLPELPPRLQDWSDDDAVLAMARVGEDLPGNLIVGDESFQRWQLSQSGLTPLAPTARLAHYASLAGEPPYNPSSAAGEQPKFTASVLREDGSTQHVIVKYSPLYSEGAARRWADLLIAEHHALSALHAAGVPAARTQILDDGRRVYLEVERFDRLGSSGRIGLVSMAAVDHEFVGDLRVWSATARQLARQARLSQDDLRRIQQIEAYSAWIGNGDRHFGNLSFTFDGSRLCLAPAYDILPMDYAPTAAGIPAAAGMPPVFTADVLDASRVMRATARSFWQRVADDLRVSDDFRGIATTQARSI